MNVYDNSLYLEDVNYVANLNLPWEKLNNKSIMISGATGLIGSMLVDIIMRKNNDNLNCTVYALGRSEERMRNRFKYCFENPLFHFIEYDVNRKLCLDRGCDSRLYFASLQVIHTLCSILQIRLELLQQIL